MAEGDAGVAALSGAPGVHCRWCGGRVRSEPGVEDDGGTTAAPGCDGTGTTCRRDLDPPRWCPTCGRRLRLQVSPTGFTATCRTHGPLPPVPGPMRS